MIRKAEKKDINDINILGFEIFPNFSNTYNIEEYLCSDNYVILVNEDDKINGVVIINKNYDFYELELIIVNRDDRKKGIATRLLTYFFDYYKDEKYLYIILEVNCENLQAIQLYKKFGFEIFNVRKKYYNGIDGLLMKKVL